MLRATLLVSLLWLAQGESLEGATIFVDGTNPNCPGAGTITNPYCQIQLAIMAAVNGDVVSVAPGTYFENIDFRGKNIVVESGAGPWLATINGNASGSCVTFSSGEGPTAILRGMRVVNGGGTPDATNSNALGGGIFIQGASPTIEGNEITGHIAASLPPLGAGIYSENGSPSIEGNMIHNNTAAKGGALFATSSPNIRVRDNEIRDNRASIGSGIVIDATVGALVLDNDFLRNGPPGTFGPPFADAAPAMSFDNCSQLSVRGNLIEQSFTEHGAPVELYSCMGEFDGNTIQDCGAGEVGGLFAFDCTDLRLTGNTIQRNSGSRAGGAEITSCVGTILDGNRFAANQSFFVACLLLASPSGVAVKRNIFEDHDLPQTSPDAVVCANGGATFEDCLFARNQISLLCYASTEIRRCTFGQNSISPMRASSLSPIAVDVASCILFQNNSTSLPPILEEGAAVVNVSDSLVEGGWPSGTNVLNTDPLFVDPINGNFNLSANSPCLDSGSATDFVCDVDLDGKPRRISASFSLSSRVDMGAYEFSNIALEATPVTPSSFQLTSSGPAGLPTLMLVGVAAGMTCQSTAGTILIDLTAPWVLVPWSPLPSQVMVQLPTTLPGIEFHLQQVALGSIPGTGNLSNVALLSPN